MTFLLAFAAAPAPISALDKAVAAQDESAPSISADLPSGLFSGARDSQVLAVQVLLDRTGHSPGIIDGMMGANTRRAILAFQRAHGLGETGEPGPDQLRRLAQAHSGALLQSHRIEAEVAGGPYEPVPSGMTGQAELDRLGFESAAEALAEKFHMSLGLLEALNPNVDFTRPGTRILVASASDRDLPTGIARIEVDKANSALRAYGPDGKLVASYPATVGSSTFPSPSGSMTVRAVAHDPKYYFDPGNRDWGPDRRLTIAAGPNNPVGAVWIDLSRDGYGIHGTPEPHLIGKTASHGCVRLTNWDARELAGAVTQGTQVDFV